MPLMQKHAKITWAGDLKDGSGQLSVGSQAFPEQTVTFRVRTEGGEKQTSPEELIAAAHATCYAMSLANRLKQNETPPELLTVSAVCSLDKVDGGLKITRVDLSAEGSVPGLDEAVFRVLAEEAEKRCPVSNALRGNVQIGVTAKLGAGVR